MGARLVVLVLIVVLALVFILQNQAPCQVRFLWWDPQVPTIVPILVALTLGFVGGSILAALCRRRPGREEKSKGVGIAGR